MRTLADKHCLRIEQLEVGYLTTECWGDECSKYADTGPEHVLESVLLFLGYRAAVGHIREWLQALEHVDWAELAKISVREAQTIVDEEVKA